MDNQNQQNNNSSEQLTPKIDGKTQVNELSSAPGLSSKPRKRPFLVTFAIALLLVFLIPGGLIGGFLIKCKVGQNNVKNNNKVAISQFDKTKLTSTDNTAPNVYLGGDCVDSRPYVQVTKRVPNDKTAPELLADMRTTLSSQGYTLSNEKVRNGSCGYNYESDANGNGIKFTLSFNAYVSDPNNSQFCNPGREADESVLAGKPVQNVDARLKT